MVLNNQNRQRHLYKLPIFYLFFHTSSDGAECGAATGIAISSDMEA
jgi:hypothetical protein